MQATEADHARLLLLGPHGDTTPGVGQIGGRLPVVGQASAGDSRHGGGHALVVSDELGCGEAVLAGPLVPVAEPQGLGEQRPLGGQPTGLPGPLAGCGLLGMAAGLPSPKPPGQQHPGQGGDPADEG